MATLDLHDETLDAGHGPTRLLLALEYWKNQALEARIERDELRFEKAMQECKDTVRDNIISTCVARNPDMPNSKIKEHCEAEFAFVTGAKK